MRAYPPDYVIVACSRKQQLRTRCVNPTAEDDVQSCLARSVFVEKCEAKRTAKRVIDARQKHIAFAWNVFAVKDSFAKVRIFSRSNCDTGIATSSLTDFVWKTYQRHRMNALVTDIPALTADSYFSSNTVVHTVCLPPITWIHYSPPQRTDKDWIAMNRQRWRLYRCQ